MDARIDSPDSSPIPHGPRIEPHGATDGGRTMRRRDAQVTGSLEALQGVLDLLQRSQRIAPASTRSPIPAGCPRDVLGAAHDELGPPDLPREGMGSEAALRRVASVLFGRGLDLSHPHVVAHLQPPPLAVAVAADAMASSTNGSVDTYDSGPTGVAMERWLVATLARLAGLSDRADGVMTPGGSISNLLGVLLARDAAGLRLGLDVRREGVRRLGRPVVFCSELAHFSVHRACAALGLGEEAVRHVNTDAARRMRPLHLARMLRDLAPDELPLCIVATAGTTDFGTVDPLTELADLAQEHGIWLHVDAAYGFGALFSERLSPRLRGLARADSITLDLHKLGWQPAATSMLLVAEAAQFRALDRQVAYLNPPDDGEAGLDGLLGRSLQTTRRPDAVKAVASLLALGRRGMGEMVDHCHALAHHAQQRIASEGELQLVAPAELTTVVFRYLAPGLEADDPRHDAVNARLRRRLLERGQAVIGRTSVVLEGSPGGPRTCLKFTLLNPATRPAELDQLIELVLEAGRACAADCKEPS